MNVWKGVCIFIAQVLFFATTSVSAQNNPLPAVYRQISTLADQYKEEKGVKMMICHDGFKLQTVKVMLRKEFGKEFVDNIKAFAIIFYGETESSIAEKIVAQIEEITTPLQKINIDAQLRPGAKGSGYVRLSEDGQILTDLLIVTELPSPKLIYFGGNFKPDKVQYKR